MISERVLGLKVTVMASVVYLIFMNLIHVITIRQTMERFGEPLTLEAKGKLPCNLAARPG